eukprot:2167714-Amphidinium_carterae.2
MDVHCGHQCGTSVDFTTSDVNAKQGSGSLEGSCFEMQYGFELFTPTYVAHCHYLQPMKLMQLTEAPGQAMASAFFNFIDSLGENIAQEV